MKPKRSTKSIEQAEKFAVGRGVLRTTILSLLKKKSRCAYQVGKDLREADPTLNMPFGQLYPLLNRMEEERLITGHWVEGHGPKGIYIYKITAAGETALKRSQKTLLQLMASVRAIVAGRV